MQIVFQLGSSQYLVSPGQEIVVDRQLQKDGQIKLDQVLLVIDDSQTIVGQPTVPSAFLSATIVGHHLGPKTRVATYKAKSRYRKVKGFRPHQTRLKIGDLSYKKASVKSNP